MTLYCDTSSLVKLYSSEADSEQIRELFDAASVVTTSVVTYVEMRATLARLRREQRLPPHAFTKAKGQFEADWDAFVAIDLDESVMRAAAELTASHALRALDAIHLASFVKILERRTDDDVCFSSFDERLSNAARRLR